MSDNSAQNWPRDIPSNIPRPDPSALTVRALTEVKTELRNEFNAALEGARLLLDTASRGRYDNVITRIEGMDKASALLEANVNRVPTLLDREAGRLESLFEQKLTKVDTEMIGMRLLSDSRLASIQTLAEAFREAASKAIEAAFAASERVNTTQSSSFTQQMTKSEASFTKEIDGLKALIATTRAATQTDIANLTGRLDRGEGGIAGGRQKSGDLRDNLGTFIAVIAIIISIGVAFVGTRHSDAQGAITLSPPNSGPIAQLPQIPQLPQNQPGR